MSRALQVRAAMVHGRSFARVALPVAAAFVTLGAAVSQARPDTREVSYSRSVQPVFDHYCAFCHTARDTFGGLILEQGKSYESLVGAYSSESRYQRVVPGKLEKSYLYLKLMGRHREAGGIGSRMPPGWQQLSPADLATITTWIRQGAKNN